MLSTLVYSIFNEHAPAHLAIALLVCVTGSFLSVRMLRDYCDAAGPQRRYRAWLLSIVAGGTIWTTHYIATLGYRPTLVSGHDPSVVALSLFIAITSVLMAVSSASAMRGPLAPEAAGVLLGLGLSAMHYVEMSGYAVGSAMRMDPLTTIASIAFALGGGALTFNRVLRRTRRPILLGTVSLALTVGLLHFTGMSAMRLDTSVIVPLPLGYASPDGLVLPVALVMGLVLVLGLASLQIDTITGAESVARLRQAARKDPLTGLLNRTGLTEQLDRLRQANGALQPLTLIAIDLDELKQVNSTHGTTAGDEMLRGAARRILDWLPPEGIAARVGGDEFYAVIPDARDPQGAVELGTSLVATLNKPMRWQGDVIRMRASAGLVLCPAQGHAVSALFAAADVALYDSKRRGGRQATLYDPDMARTIRTRRELGDDLVRAFEAGEFHLHYQPQFDLNARRVTGFEALLRWNHPRRGPIVPADFVPLAEERGLIDALGDWVLREAVQEAAGWTVPCRLAVNVSAPQFESGALVDTVRDLLSATGLPPELLELEITEGLVIEDLPSVQTQVAALKEIGVLVTMDDYGTGYSALTTLLALPFDKVKFDRSFIERIDEDPRMIGVLQSCVALGRHLGITVLAEGVETDEQAQALSEIGCDEIQGYLIGRPMPAEDTRRRFALDGTGAIRWDADLAAERKDRDDGGRLAAGGA